MKILVIDDTAINLMSAEQTLVGHQLTLVDTYDRAYELLVPLSADGEAVGSELARRGFQSPFRQAATAEEKKAYWIEEKRVEKNLRPAPAFEAVLTDLLMPAGKQAQCGKGLGLVGQIMPVGFSLAFQAVLAGARYVGVCTATNHHHHPASAMLDRFVNRGQSADLPFAVNESILGFYQHDSFHPVEGTHCSECEGGWKGGRECFTCRGTGKGDGKDWGRVLRSLLSK